MNGLKEKWQGNGSKPIIVIAIAIMAFAALLGLSACGGQQQDVAQTGEPQATEQSTYEGVDDPWVEGGKFTTGDAELDRMVKETCDAEYGNYTSEDRAERAYNTFLYITRHDYVERYEGEQYENQHPQGPDWDKLYAKQFYLADTGNCYEFAAMAQFALRYYGYDDAVGQPCLVKQESGDYGQHGLVFVTNDAGEPTLCDPSFSANGYMLPGGSYTFMLEDVGQGPVTIWQNSTPQTLTPGA